MKFLVGPLNAYPEATSAPRSKWFLILFLLPFLLYLLLRNFERNLTDFIIPYFPVEPDKSYGFYRDLVRLCLNEMLWLSFFLLLAVVLFIYVPLSRTMNVIDQHLVGRPRLYITLIVSVSVVLFVFIAYCTLRTFANSGDEYVYLYQAETLSEGRLWNPSPPLEDFFLYSHIAQQDGISVGRFPPGWPLLLSIPFVLGFPPFLLNPILGCIALILFYSFSKRYYGERVAIWSVASLAMTSFFIFNAASYFSHTACLLFVLGFVYCLYLSLDRRSAAFALLAGAFLGATVITRYLNAVLIFLPVFAYLVFHFKWRSVRTLFLIGIGALPFIAFLTWYNFKITGNGLLPVTVWADPREGLGFGVRGHTPVEGVEHFIRRVLLFLYWCSPALLILYAVYLFHKLRHKVERFLHPEDYFVLMMMIGYFFYYHIGGNQYGPRFWLEGLPFLILFVVKKTFDARSKWPMALLLAGLIYGLVKMPYIIGREKRIVEERMDIYDQVKQAGINNAVVLVTSHTGIIRPMGQLDLSRNALDYNGDVIYVLDLGDRNREVIRHYPNRSIYRYVRHPEKVEGQLQRLR